MNKNKYTVIIKNTIAEANARMELNELLSYKKLWGVFEERPVTNKDPQLRKDIRNKKIEIKEIRKVFKKIMKELK